MSKLTKSIICKAAAFAIASALTVPAVFGSITTSEAAAAKLNVSSKTVNKGKTYQLKVTGTKSGSKITWSTSNKKVVTVTNKGLVKAVNVGTADISAKVTVNKATTTLKCKVTVKAPATQVTLTKQTSTMKVGNSFTFRALLAPANSTDSITWSSSNKSVATINTTGLVTALAEGVTTIKAKATNGKSVSVTLLVNPTTKYTGKKIVMYYPNWRIYSDSSMALDKIPWNKMTHINHAFWTVAEDFTVAPTDDWADLYWDQGYSVTKDGTVIQILKDNNGAPVMAGKDSYKLVGSSQTVKVSDVAYTGQFAVYKAMTELYPDVTVVMSVGGWSRGENFHAMAMSKQSRKIFIKSLVSLIEQYPWMDGIDLDWEYPVVDRPADDDDPVDRGCPGGPEDRDNFTALLSEIRAAFDAKGWADKTLTICEPVNTQVAGKQDLAGVAKSVDFINVMTYDAHGSFDAVTGALSPLTNDAFSVEQAIDFYLQYFTKEQLNIGTPFYSRGWQDVEADANGDPMNQPAANGGFRGDVSWDAVEGTYTQESVANWLLSSVALQWKLEDKPSLAGTSFGTRSGGQSPWWHLKELETTPGWVAGYDEDTQSAWLYNPEKKWMYTYENEKSLQAKIDYINAQNLGGMIVWEMGGDSAKDGFPMTTILSNGLLK